MAVHVKICGITGREDALKAEELGASAVGFVFHPGSPRYIQPGRAGEISSSLGPFVARVGVFVDCDPVTVRDIVSDAGLTAVQLHGSEPPGYIGELDGITVIKAFRVGPDFDPGELGKYRVSAFLLDTYDKHAYGGTGKTFEWERALPCLGQGRIILAGGLGPDNIREALRKVHPWGVDVSSGVELNPGQKDHKKMTALFDAVTGEYTI